MEASRLQESGRGNVGGVVLFRRLREALTKLAKLVQLLMTERFPELSPEQLNHSP